MTSNMYYLLTFLNDNINKQHDENNVFYQKSVYYIFFPNLFCQNQRETFNFSCPTLVTQDIFECWIP